MNVLFLDSEPLYDDLLPAGLRQIGCTVKTVTEVLDGQLDSQLSDFRPDFALTLGWSAFPTNERLEALRKVIDHHRIPLIYWATEDPCWHEDWSVPYVRNMQPDLALTICDEYVSRYEAMGVQAACLPVGYNHEIYRPTAARPEYACDVAVVANFYGWQFEKLNRRRSLYDLVRPLLDGGYDLKIWGNNWGIAPQFGLPVAEGMLKGYLHHREAAAVYSSAKIVIGLQNEFDFETNLTMRTCEVMGSGGFLLTSQTRAVERLFEHNRHLVMSGSPEETLELVNYFLGHPDERAKIAAAGEALVRSHHTYEHRASEALELFERLKYVRPAKADCPPVPLPKAPYCPDDCCHCCCHTHFHFHFDCCDHKGHDCCDHKGHDCSGDLERVHWGDVDIVECCDISGDDSGDCSGAESGDCSGAESGDCSGAESGDCSGDNSGDESGDCSGDDSGGDRSGS